MTFFITREYVAALLPVMVVLLGALLSARWPIERAAIALALVAEAATWPSAPEEALSRAFAHDRLTALAQIVFLLVALAQARPVGARERMVTLFAAMLAIGGNDVIIQLIAAWLLLRTAPRWQMSVAAAAVAVFCVSGQTELAAAGFLALVWGTVLAATRQPALLVGAVRCVLVGTLSTEWAWRLGVLR